MHFLNILKKFFEITSWLVVIMKMGKESIHFHLISLGDVCCVLMTRYRESR